MAEVFVSYARSTAKEAQAVAGALRSEGYGVWLDEDLPAHRGFTEVIEERLRAAGAVVVIWSTEAARSEWVQSEADAARAAHKLVQVTVDGARLPMPFDRIHCADLQGWTGGVDAPGWRKVLASVRDLLDEAVPGLGRRSHASGPTEPLLAVLAFDNLSGDAEMAYFSDGVSEEILQTVARGAELRVIGRGSSFQFRGPDKAAAHVGHALKATHVLDGSVRRSGSKVRIATNLIECAGETTLWSDRFDRELSDVFALQDEIAGAVAAALKVAFAPAAQPGAVDPSAYTLYLKAREIRNRGLLSPATVIAVIEQLDEATRLAPNFARAWEFLATMQVEHLRFDQAGHPLTIRRADVVAAAETALRLDRGLGAAYQALGQLEPFGRFAEREAFHTKALSAAPNDPTVLTNASLFFAEVGRVRDALACASRAYDLDPMYPWAASWYACTAEYAGRDAECLGLWDSYCARWPDNELIAWGAICAALDYGQWIWFDDLIRTSSEKGFNSPTLHAAITYGQQLRESDADVSAHVLQRVREKLARNGVLSIFDFTKLHRLGMTEEAFELIAQSSFDYMFDPDKGSPNGAEGPSMMFNVSHASAMMRDVRFVGLCDRLGLCDYWTKTGRWPDCADVVAPYYDFRAEARRLAS
jgi:TolB-like protein